MSNPTVNLSEIERTASLRRRREALESRLDDGDRRIQDAERSGKDVSAWEVFWIDLLREYEAVCDDLGWAA